MLDQQKNLLAKIDKLSTLPHSIMLLGDEGSGHEEICDYVAKRFNLHLIKLEDGISQALVDEIYTINMLTLYTINMNTLTEREQNVLLKLFEEPNTYTYIILYGEYVNGLILDTIKSRSYILEMDKFDFDYIASLIQDKNNIQLISSLCWTPGHVEIANHTNINELYNLCNTMLNCIGSANFQNALSIANKINFKDEYDKYDFWLFIKMLGYCILHKENITNSDYLIYELLTDLSYKVRCVIDKRKQFEHFITVIWEGIKSLQEK